MMRIVLIDTSVIRAKKIRHGNSTKLKMLSDIPSVCVKKLSMLQIKYVPPDFLVLNAIQIGLELLP